MLCCCAVGVRAPVVHKWMLPGVAVGDQQLRNVCAKLHLTQPTHIEVTGNSHEGYTYCCSQPVPIHLIMSPLRPLPRSALRPPRSSATTMAPRQKRRFPDATQHTFSSAGLLIHILTFLDPESIVRVQSTNKAFYEAAAQPASWAHTRWDPIPEYKRELAHILQYSMPHLHTLELRHRMWRAGDLDVSMLTRLQSLELVNDDIDFGGMPYYRDDVHGEQEVETFLQNI